MAVAVGIGALFLLLLARIPVGYAIAVAGCLGLFLAADADTVLGILETGPYSSSSNYSLMAIPMFILMAEFVIVCGLADDLFDAARLWVGRAPAGLGVATTLAGALFAALSGSSTASAAALSGTAIPQMTKQGYHPRVAAGLVAVVGTLAMMIPPSIALIFYGILARQSVGQLLIAGFVPGLLVALTLVITLLIRVKMDSTLAPPREGSSMRDKFASLRTVGPLLFLFFLVTGVLYLGVATPTETSALGAFGAFLIALLRGRLSWPKLCIAFATTASVSAMIMMIVVGAHIFGVFLSLTQVTTSLVEAVGGLNVAPIVILLVILAMYLVLGCFMDQIAIVGLTVPVVAPLIGSLGYDLIWFGVIMVLIAEIGMVTPPFGMNSFIVARYAQIPVETVFVGVLPYVLALGVLIGVLVGFPEIVLWLPRTMG